MNLKFKIKNNGECTSCLKWKKGKRKGEKKKNHQNLL